MPSRKKTQKQKLERYKNTAGLVYYLIMIIFAVMLFIFFFQIRNQLTPLLNYADNMTSP